MTGARCWSCREPMAAGAAFCGACGSPAVRPRTDPPVTKVQVFAVLALAGAVLFWFLATREEEGPTRAVSGELPPVATTAEDLIGAYEKNEIAADEKFKGRRVVVTGKVDRIRTDLLDDPVVHLGGGFVSVDCYFDERHKRRLAKLSPGDQVKLRGVGKGQTLGSPQLGDCEVVEPK